MFKAVDPYTYTLSTQLYAGSTCVGLFTVGYHVTHYDDVQLDSGTIQSGVARSGVRKYALSVTQRVMVYNPSGLAISPRLHVTSYADYPALLNLQLVASGAQGTKLLLTGYSPQTVNTKVQTSGMVSDSSGSTSGSSVSRTSGSTTAQSNSYGASVGVSGDGPSVGLSAEMSSTTTAERSHTATSESGTSSEQEASSSAFMSIEDWGAYALVNPLTTGPVWTFGQEYPWDAIACRISTGDVNPVNQAQEKVVVPNEMMVRLYDGTSLYPPSHLSMFGIDFSAHAQWIVTVADAESDQVALSHGLEYFTASHSLANGGVTVYLDTTPTTLYPPSGDGISTTIDLGVLGLDPVGRAEAPAVVGFTPSKFTVAPVAASEGTQPTAFSIFSDANTLLVRDTTDYPDPCADATGFTAGETALTGLLTGTNTSLTLTVLFKVVDVVSDYTLHLKHWKITSTGVVLTIVVNGDTGNKLVKYVDSVEAEGGENNLLSIALRDRNFASVDYTDLLTMGLNSIAITVDPIDAGATAGYALRALSIEPS
ncbi:hypothetical protein ACIBEJ_47390 [Nonomuraea sp. NPDC050790]|uniref:hypothetical protein n=1 Tax=Nonomuraea sp. NPDC050790 TaxID=3364371 RepID=UPI003796F516